MKNRKKLFIILIIFLLVFIIIFGIVKFLADQTRLTIKERNWLSNNINNVQNISILNDDDVFGNSGQGVFFDFVADFEADYDLDVNPIAYKLTEIPNGIILGKANEVTENELVFYTDHYVIMSKNYELITNIHDLEGKNIGIKSTNLSQVANYLANINFSFSQYESNESLKEALNNSQVEYIITPLIENLQFMLANDLSIIYHLSDIPCYYFLRGTNDEFSSILKKYYLTWQKEEKNYFNQAELNLFTSTLNISETEVDALRSMEFKYGFVNNSPYEIIIGGNYGGIVAIYLQDFSNFADLDFTFTKYKNYDKFLANVEKEKIDIYYNYYNLNNSFETVKAEMPIKFSIIAKNDNNLVINSLNSLKGKEVYVLENSLIKSYLEQYNLNLKTYKNNKGLFRLLKKDIIAVLDTNIYNYYSKTNLQTYSARFEDYLAQEYTFKVNNNSAFYKLFQKYISTLDYQQIVNRGLQNHYETIKNGTILSKIAQYILYILIIVAITFFIVYKRTKKITIVKKIRKEDKMKFVDQLTSLKNRNYLKENIESWNNNSVYPQAMIVVDLNSLQYINDTLGYEQGDKQIRAAANILIRTQLDCSDIMRTDGNEFLIYLVGYTQKQISSYIHKLNKEFKKLPYEYGAEFGYSFIVDDIKTIEDAINEAVEEMRKQKKALKKEDLNEKKT